MAKFFSPERSGVTWVPSQSLSSSHLKQTDIYLLYSVQKNLSLFVCYYCFFSHCSVPYASDTFEWLKFGILNGWLLKVHSDIAILTTLILRHREGQQQNWKLEMQFALEGCKLLSTYFDYIMSGRLAKTIENMKLLKKWTWNWTGFKYKLKLSRQMSIGVLHTRR